VIPALARGLVEDSRRLAEVIQGQLANTPRTQQIKLKVNALQVATGQLNQLLKLRDLTPQRRQEAVHDVRQVYQPVVDALSQPGLNIPGAQRISERIGQKIGSLEDAVGIAHPPQMVSIEIRLQRALINEYTVMIAAVDSFMAGLNDKVPEGPQIRVEALALRDAVWQLRRHIAQGVPDRRISQELVTAINAQRILANRVQRLNQGRVPGPNIFRLRRIGEILTRIQGAANMP
jgi:hypothetical protein